MGKLVTVSTSFGTQILVSEYKKRQIEEIIEKASSCELIDQIILFGSTISDSCTENSDIDIVVISKASVSKLSQNKRYRAYSNMIYGIDNFKTEFDVLYFSSYEDIINKKEKAMICKEIAEKGKIIYIKEGCA